MLFASHASHMALSALQFRDPQSDILEWSRYDTVAAYDLRQRRSTHCFHGARLLAPYRTKIDAERRALQPVADFLDVPLDDLWRDVVTEWDEAGMMKAIWLPRAFRDGRALYTLSFPAGWWIDITASETMAALNQLSRGSWPTSHGMKCRTADSVTHHWR